MKKLMMKTKMKKIINAINEDFFDDIESKDIINDKIDIVNDEIEQENDTINPEDYTHVLKLTLEIAENPIFIKDIIELGSSYINDFVNTLKIIIKKIEYILDISRFVKNHSNIIINQGVHINYLDDVIDVKGLRIHTSKKHAFEKIYTIDLVYYATFNITNPKQAVNFYSQHCEGSLNKNTMFYVNCLSIERTNESENRLLDINKRFEFDTKVSFFQIQNYIYDLCTVLSDKKDMYANILKCYSLNNAADSLFENTYNDFSSTLHSSNRILNCSPIIKNINMFSVPYFYSEHTIPCKCLDDCPSHYNNLVDWIKKTPFRLYTLVKDDKKLLYIVMCVFNGTYNYLNAEYVITISSNCSNMSELDGYGDKRGFYKCLKMIQSLGYSEKDALDMLKSDFERFNDTVYDEYVNNPELFIKDITY